MTLPHDCKARLRMLRDTIQIRNADKNHEVETDTSDEKSSEANS